VIAVDTNILVAAHRRDANRHELASAAVRRLAEAPTSWAIPWSCVHEFLGVVTHPRIFRTPTTVGAALLQVETWLASPSLAVLAERFDHWSHLRSAIEEGDARGPRVHDARVAATCLAHGVTVLWTADRDFGRFPRLRTHNPLVG
jgi:toxin-antitoxin system PIN domain toxin